jgi:hypothetical protein
VGVFCEAKPQKGYLKYVQWSEAERCLTALLSAFIDAKPAIDFIMG